ncbi:hypothetical protein AQUCO_03100047v1 [Aquilegia coerulea]|uniref:Uncharacterized protein n=2 Tax=Aquilegia coerulea TaxID=218851 RepID=A0A2G5D0G5_AQUCA|nr:hypothetical protein AQUCO_03100047v1 [Aquilegia coerulea]
MADRFSELPEHLLRHLLNFVTKEMDLDELIRFSLVCQYWNSFAKPLLPPKLLPLLIVPYDDDYISSVTETDFVCNKTLGFFSFHNLKHYKVEIPQIADRRICGSCKGGWLITVHENGEIQALHPFTKSIFHLPPVSTLPDSSRHMVEIITSSKMCAFTIYKAVMSSPCPTTSILMVIQGFGGRLAFCQPGKDRKWISVSGSGNFDDVIFYQGHFYAVRDEGHVFVVCGLESPSPFVKLVIVQPEKWVYRKKHLIECHGELLLVMKFPYRREPGGPVVVSFLIYKADFSRHKWEEIEYIDRDSALFVGSNGSFTCSTSIVPDCKGNCIYFTDDCLVHLVQINNDSSDYEDEDESFDWQDIGKYSLTDEVFQRQHISRSDIIMPAVWFTTYSY